MKTSAILLFLILPMTIFSQIPNDNLRKIRVSGNSFSEFEPVSYVAKITIKEYTISDYNQTSIKIVKIDSIENLLKKNLVRFGFDVNKLEEVSINNENNSNNNKDYILLNSIYEYKFNSYDELKSFVKTIRFEGLSRIYIRPIYNINISEIETDLSISALKESRIKAVKILASVNKSLGEIINIDLITDNTTTANNQILDDENYFSNMNQIDLKRKKYYRSHFIVTYEIK